MKNLIFIISILVVASCGVNDTRCFFPSGNTKVEFKLLNTNCPSNLSIPENSEGTLIFKRSLSCGEYNESGASSSAQCVNNWTKSMTIYEDRLETLYEFNYSCKTKECLHDFNSNLCTIIDCKVKYLETISPIEE